MIDILKFTIALIIGTVVYLLPVWVPVIAILLGATHAQLILSCVISILIWVVVGVWMVRGDEKNV